VRSSWHQSPAAKSSGLSIHNGSAIGHADIGNKFLHAPKGKGAKAPVECAQEATKLVANQAIRSSHGFFMEHVFQPKIA
jgi:hypothetical protein